MSLDCSTASARGVPGQRLGTGTQVVSIGIGKAAFGTSPVVTDAVTAAGWAINIVPTEAIVRLVRAHKPHRATAPPRHRATAPPRHRATAPHPPARPTRRTSR